ncbi:MAG: hypothetical protein IPJ20_16960 [Flammeovirgaceae bacterium]|nr:hypothetical protein [Flammeovirgaceae bacterium]
MIIEEAYKNKKEDKIKTIYCRMDLSMHRELCEIRNLTGVSLSELLRSSARSLIKNAKEKGEVKVI